MADVNTFILSTIAQKNRYFSISEMEVKKVPSSSSVCIDLCLLLCLSLSFPKNPLSSTTLDSRFSVENLTID